MRDEATPVSRGTRQPRHVFLRTDRRGVGEAAGGQRPRRDEGPRADHDRCAAAFLMMPAYAALGMILVYQMVDAMWRAAGDTSTDFNFYTKRAILAGVYSTTLMRWFTDKTADEAETRAFLDARIGNVMQFEKFKAEMKERTKDMPSFAD